MKLSEDTQFAADLAALGIPDEISFGNAEVQTEGEPSADAEPEGDAPTGEAAEIQGQADQEGSESPAQGSGSEADAPREKDATLDKLLKLEQSRLELENELKALKAEKENAPEPKAAKSSDLSERFYDEDPFDVLEELGVDSDYLFKRMAIKAMERDGKVPNKELLSEVQARERNLAQDRKIKKLESQLQYTEQLKIQEKAVQDYTTELENQLKSASEKYPTVGRFAQAAKEQVMQEMIEYAGLDAYRRQASGRPGVIKPDELVALFERRWSPLLGSSTEQGKSPATNKPSTPVTSARSSTTTKKVTSEADERRKVREEALSLMKFRE